MLGQHFTVSYFLPGTLAANHVQDFTVPFDCKLKEISAVAQNDSDATLMVGTSADDDGWITAYAIGDSGTPNTKGLANFNGALLTSAGAEWPRAVDGTIVRTTLDYNGNSGTAAQNVTVVLTFEEG